MQFECGTRILRVIHGRDARATSPNCISTIAVGSRFRGATVNHHASFSGIQCGVAEITDTPEPVNTRCQESPGHLPRVLLQRSPG